MNFLGAVDDGKGRWADGFMFNDKHPNASGHRELALTFVPTLFEALERGKPAPIKPASSAGFARISDGGDALRFAPESTMHPFAVSIAVRTTGDGDVVTMSGAALAATMEDKRFGSGPAAVGFKEATLSSDGGFTSRIGIHAGRWTYTFFVDGKLAGETADRLEPAQFVIGGRGDYKDLLLFRSALNADEVAVLEQGRLLQASLEVYSPLADAQFRPDSEVENEAQSLSAFHVVSGRIVHAQDK